MCSWLCVGIKFKVPSVYIHTYIHGLYAVGRMFCFLFKRNDLCGQARRYSSVKRMNIMLFMSSMNNCILNNRIYCYIFIKSGRLILLCSFLCCYLLPEQQYTNGIIMVKYFVAFVENTNNFDEIKS